MTHYLDSLPEDIEKRFAAVCARLARQGFHPYRYAQRSLVTRKDHPEALLKALERLDREFAFVRKPWAYLERIMSVESGKFAARDYTAKAQAEKKALGMVTVGTGLAAMLLKAIEEKKKE